MLLQSERGSWRVGLRSRGAAKLSSTGSSPSHVRSISSTSSESSVSTDSTVTIEGVKKEIAVDSKIVYEFGGPTGVSLLMIGFPYLMCYLYICLAVFNGHLQNPLESTFWRRGIPFIIPTKRAAAIYLTFNVLQYVTAATMPGIKVLGLPVPSLGGKQLEYLCNGVATWYVDLVLVAVLHITCVFPITTVVDDVGNIMTVAMLWGIVVTLATYIVGHVKGNTHRMSGSITYDIFMGAILNPRIGNVDLKMWSEIRIPWKLLFFITLSAAVKEHEINVARKLEAGITPQVWSLLGGLVQMNAIQTSAPLLFMLLAHCLYVNACMKGEECIPTTWDIFYEKWGYMLIFWNLAGVPFSYCYSTLYLLNRSLAKDPIQHSRIYTTSLFIVLMGSYYVWDTANSQKNRFRMQQRGTYVERNTFPQLPWGTMKNPTFVQTKHGNKLLTGGWWGIARKIHYTADLVMALSWGLITGFDSYIPYFYVCFFTVVLAHRVRRDHLRCKEKYGKDFEEYCRQVPYIFIPFIF
jgi:delta24(24(1))-sterol reductase|eukprot:scaffold1736_cov190-Alexandrium_tamarense.AAC.18